MKRIAIFCFFLVTIISFNLQAQNLGLHVEEGMTVLFGADTSGGGMKMFWVPSKAAFRAGEVSTDQWNYDSIGLSSFAWSTDNLAYGENASSWGLGNRALGAQSTVWGFENEGLGQENTAWGKYNFVDSVGSTVWGLQNRILGRYSTGWGDDNVSTGRLSTVWGWNNIAQSSLETVLGQFADTLDHANEMEWEPDDYLLVAGNGSHSKRSNAFTLLKNGNLGLGNIYPSHLLELSDSVANVPSLQVNNKHSAGVGITATSGKIGVKGTISTDSDDFAKYGGYFEGDGENAKGIYAKTTGTGTSANGILAVGGGPNSYAGWFAGRVTVDGNLHVTGTFSNSVASLKIDHPVDPANLYLSHSIVESPDMMNIYSGNVTTDLNGSAGVMLPDYFEALNKDFTYQLTVIGSFAQAIISEEIRDNSFEIKTNQPNVKVSWQVTGIRKDSYAIKNPIEVEKHKGVNAGKYLNPEAFDQPLEMGINYNPKLKTKY